MVRFCHSTCDCMEIQQDLYDYFTGIAEETTKMRVGVHT